MKAAVFEQLHTPLRYTDFPDPQPGSSEVLIRLHAAALNHRDIWIQRGLYPGVVTPIILGSDGAGVVIAAGSDQHSHWVGKEVIINPSQNWGDNPAYYGPDHKILGLPDNGTFAELVKVPATSLTPKPAHLTFEQASALPMAGLTAWRALFSRARLTPGAKVLITGAGGGVALTAVQIAVAFGAEVWVTSGSDYKIARLTELGARGGINYNNPTWHRDLLIKTQSKKQGYFNVIIDSAGGPGFARLIDLAAPGASICFYGGGKGNITDIVPARVFFKQLNILGSTMGTPAEFADMVRFVETHGLIPVIDQLFPLAEAEKAVRYMDSGEQFGKIVLKTLGYPH